MSVSKDHRNLNCPRGLHDKEKSVDKHFDKAQTKKQYINDLKENCCRMLQDICSFMLWINSVLIANIELEINELKAKWLVLQLSSFIPPICILNIQESHYEKEDGIKPIKTAHYTLNFFKRSLNTH